MKQNYFQKNPHLPLGKLKQSLIDELHQMDVKKIHPIINEVLMSVMLLLGEEKTMFRAKKELSDPKFIQKLKDVRKENIHMDQIRELENYTTQRGFTPMEALSQSIGACYLCEWVLIMQSQAHDWNMKQKILSFKKPPSARNRASSQNGGRYKAMLALHLEQKMPKFYDRQNRNGSQKSSKSRTRKNNTFMDERIRSQGKPTTKLGMNTFHRTNSEKEIIQSKAPEIRNIHIQTSNSKITPRHRNLSYQSLKEPDTNIVNIFQERKTQMTKKATPSEGIGLTRRSTMNLHDNYFDMNVLYEKQKNQRAHKMRKLQEEQARQREEARLETLKLAKFNKEIRQENGKLDYQQIKKLPLVYKTNYIQMVIEQDNKTRSVLDTTEKKVADSTSDLCELIWGIEDTKATWDNSISRINEVLEQKAEEIGITHSKFQTSFQEFDILDMAKVISKCKNCYQGLSCPEHKLQRKDQTISDTFIEKNNSTAKKRKSHRFVRNGRPPLQGRIII